VVLPEQGSGQLMGQMFHGIPREIFPHGQNQCPVGKILNLQQTSLEFIPEAWERL
jgi:hypothetical protein